MFSGCRLVILGLKMRSMMFNDWQNDHDGLWHSEELGEFLGVGVILYTDNIRSLVMGPRDAYLGGGKESYMSGCLC
jgi:hypothetical protein